MALACALAVALPPYVTLSAMPSTPGPALPYTVVRISSQGYVLSMGPPSYTLGSQGSGWALLAEGLPVHVIGAPTRPCLVTPPEPLQRGFAALRLQLPANLSLPLVLFATVNASRGAVFHIRAYGADELGATVNLWDELGPLDDLGGTGAPSSYAGLIPPFPLRGSVMPSHIDFVLDVLAPTQGPLYACLESLSLRPVHLSPLLEARASLRGDELALLLRANITPTPAVPVVLRLVVDLQRPAGLTIRPAYVASYQATYVGEELRQGLLSGRASYDLLLLGRGELTSRGLGHFYSALLAPPGAVLFVSSPGNASIALEGLSLIFSSSPPAQASPAYMLWLYLLYALLLPLSSLLIFALWPGALRLPLTAALGLGLRLGLAPFTGHPLDSFLFSLSSRNYLLRGEALQGPVFPVPTYVELLSLAALYLVGREPHTDLYFAGHVVGAMELLQLKLPLMLSDLASLFLLSACLRLLGLERQRAAWGSALYYLNPLSITISSAWLQYDSLSVALFLLALFALLKLTSAGLRTIAFSLAALAGPLGLVGFLYYLAKSIGEKARAAAYAMPALAGLALLFGGTLQGALLFWLGLSAQLPSRSPFSLLGALMALEGLRWPTLYTVGFLLAQGLILAGSLLLWRRPLARWLPSSLSLALLAYYEFYPLAFEQHYLWALALLPLLGTGRAISFMLTALGGVVALGANPQQLVTGLPSSLAGPYSSLLDFLLKGLASALVLAANLAAWRAKGSRERA